MKKRFLSSFLSVLLCGSMVLPSVSMAAPAAEPFQTVQTEMGTSASTAVASERQILNFNKDWRFQKGELKGAEAKDFDDTEWRSLNLPHDYSIENDFDLASEAKAGGGFLDGGPAWYRKTWIVPADMAGKRIRVEFEGVYMDSTVYVNGTKVGNYPYGYSAFSYDITDYLVADGMTENVIAVHVNNEQPSSRWYSGSGIYRDVKLIATEDVHVERYGTKITTPDLEAEYTAGSDVTVNVDSTVVNESDADAEITLRHTAYYNGSLEEPGSLDPAAMVTTEKVSLRAGEKEVVNAEMSVADPHLWEVGKGGMYSIHTEVLKDGVVIDTYDSDFGMRWLKFDPDNGFFVNGTYTKIHGVCQHHDQGALGAVNNPAALDRQIRILREMGVNAIRSSHNPASRALLDSCNEQGIMVMNEAFDCWWSSKNLYDFHRFFDTPCTHPEAEEGQTWQEYDIKNMVNGSKNDPSIIMWSIGNEIGESWSEKAVTVGGQLRDWVKEVDDTRAVTQADPIFYNIDEAAYDPANNQPHWRLINGHDAMGFNYGKYTDYDYVHEKNPDWFIYSSETSSAVSTRGIYLHPEIDDDDHASHSSHRGLNQCSEFDNDRVNWGTTLHYALREDAKRKYMGGLFFWTGFDYTGEPAPYAGGTSKSSYFGAIDTCGFPKESFYLLQSQWFDVEEQPMVHILPHWNWEDDHSIEIDGKMPIRIYSNARSVEVFLNGKSLGKKEFAYYPETETSIARQDDGSDQENLYLQWLVDYEPGTVEAVAYDADGKEIARDVRTTAGDPAAIRMTPEKEYITADGEDLCYVEVDVVDENGVMNPRANNAIQFSISGNGRIVGTDNGDPTDFTNMKSTRRSAFNGKALVIVQSTEKAGSFTLTASSAGLPISKTTVYTVNESYDKDALLGYQGVSVKTMAGVQPVLPEKVTAVYLNGNHEEAEVAWDQIEESQLAQAGILTVTGTVKADGAKVTATVEVVAPAGVLPVSAVTVPGVQPVLPAQVQLVYSDGTEETCEVTWAAIGEDKLVGGAQFMVEGTLKDLAGWKAAAYVRVSEGTEKKNVARAVSGSEYPKFEASYTSTYDPLEHVNDGIISYDTNPKNGWGNWKYAPIPEVTTLDCTLEEPLSLDNIWIYFREDDGIYIPEDTLIQYWDEEAEDWVDVSNQSQRTGFQTNEESVITFDPVVTRKLRAQFTRGAQDTTKKKDCLVLTEVEIYAYPTDKGQDTASLESLTVDGVEIEGFKPEKKDYTVTLPYGAKIPEVQAVAADCGTAFVLPALTNQSAAMIRVTSENGRVTANYTVQFEEEDPAVVSAEVRMEQTDVTEDDLAALHVDAMLESGELADEDSLSINYRILDAGVPAKAEVRNGILYAYWAGDIQIVADVSYRGGEKFTSTPLKITIAPSSAKKDIVSFAQVTVDTKLGQAPALPETVRATFSSGLPRDVLVAWDPISEDQYGAYGTFTVSGTVKGYSKKPVVTVRVRDTQAGQNVSLATPVGVEPTLPSSVYVYYTDGASVQSAVQWEDYDHELLKTAGTFTVNGTTELGGYAVTVSVRVTTETVQSENHAKTRNGCPYSKAITSYSEGNAAGALNDGLLNKWTDWSNPNANGNVWFGVIFGSDYPESRYVDTVVLDLLEDSSWDRTKIENCVVEYYNQPVGLDDVPKSVANFDAATMKDHPFNNPDNWTEVTNLQQPETYGYGNNTLTFDMVETYAIRVKVTHGTPGGTYYIALREFYAYGKLAVANSSFQVTGLTVDGKPLEGFKPETHEYELEIKNGVMPEFEMTADSNASVTRIPAANTNGAAKFVITSEDGLKSETYTIHLSDPNTQDETAKRKAAIAALEKSLKHAEALVNAGQKNYTDETRKAFVKAYEAAKAGLTDKNMTAAWLNALNIDLTKTQAGLKEKHVQNPTVLQAPGIRSVSAKAYSQGVWATIRVNAVAGADKYAVYRVAGGKETLVGTAASGKTTVTDKKLTSRKVKYFAVAIAADGTKSAKGTSKAMTLGASTKIKKVSSASSGIKITWKKAKNASKYVIYRSTKKSSGYTRVKILSKKNLSYVDRKAKKGKKYYYKVAVVRSGNASLMSPASKRVKR